MVDLPRISPGSEKFVKSPPEPSNPPTMKDITNALHFSNHLLNAHGRKEVTKDEDVVNAALYRDKLLATRNGGEPLWFAAAMARELDRRLLPLVADIQTIKNDTENLKADVQNIKTDIQSIKNDLQDLKDVQAEVQWIAAVTYNRSCGTGDSVRLQVVPFTNGANPTKAPHDLPRLMCVNDVNNLSRNDREAYYKGHHPPPDGRHRLPSAAKQIESILVAIGANTI